MYMHWRAKGDWVWNGIEHKKIARHGEDIFIEVAHAKQQTRIKVDTFQKIINKLKVPKMELAVGENNNGTVLHAVLCDKYWDTGEA